MSDTSEREAIAHEGRAAVRQARDNFDRVGDRLDELQRRYDDEDALEAFGQVEDLLMDFDDAMYEAEKVFSGVLEDNTDD